MKDLQHVKEPFKKGNKNYFLIRLFQLNNVPIRAVTFKGYRIDIHLLMILTNNFHLKIVNEMVLSVEEWTKIRYINNLINSIAQLIVLCNVIKVLII